MDIGIVAGDTYGPTTAASLLDQVRIAADAGFGTAWVSQALGWDAMTALAVAAQVPGIALGSAVVPVPQRHPLVLAGQALGVQAAAGNRLTLGIGAGIGAMVSSIFGLAADRPATRMREYLTVLRPLLRGEPVEHRGADLTAVGAVTVPGAEPPPVLLAALGPAMLRVAGELADGAVTWMTGPRTLGGHVVPRLIAAGAGRPAPRVVAGLPVCVTADEPAARARIGEYFAMAGQVPEYRAMLDREGAAGPADVAVVGDEEAVLRQVHRLRDAGATELMAAPAGTPEERKRTVAALADPAFRR